ncbi:hypothetical protein EXIGLDRAFT_831347 [Exidia glandulosa HHB12029]|uniref:Uncharacterized protein n=1 Tax=Exidia glandulosa HHB12029 TaxID=1314781 RepID=A0A165MQE2_EXIGL|nr:hypothetical protein EXIGLDRAFT_831347 [Exidia glandulosa HHB12029]
MQIFLALALAALAALATAAPAPFRPGGAEIVPDIDIGDEFRDKVKPFVATEDTIIETEPGPDETMELREQHKMWLVKGATSRVFGRSRTLA